MKVLLMLLLLVGCENDTFDADLKYCSNMVHDDLMEKRKNPNWVKFFRTAPFEVVYYYVLGRTEECLYLGKNK